MGWGGGGGGCPLPRVAIFYKPVTGLPIIMITLNNSDDTICQTKLYQAAIPFYFSTFGPNLYT